MEKPPLLVILTNKAKSSYVYFALSDAKYGRYLPTVNPSFPSEIAILGAFKAYDSTNLNGCILGDSNGYYPIKIEDNNLILGTATRGAFGNWGCNASNYSGGYYCYILYEN